jgi:hypothetical protein
MAAALSEYCAPLRRSGSRSASQGEFRSVRSSVAPLYGLFQAEFRLRPVEHRAKDPLVRGIQYPVRRCHVPLGKILR